MDPRHLLPFLLLAVLVSAPVSNGAKAQTDEERYVHEITIWLIEADRHLSEASRALTNCLANFSGCVTDPSPVVERLNASRNALVVVRAAVLSLTVPGRYRVVNDLVIQGLTHSINGTALHMEGLSEGSLAKFEAGSAFMSQGRDELREAANFLGAMPPRSLLEEVLVYLLGALAVSLAISTTLLVWWYRREMRTRMPPPRDPKGG